MSQQTRPPKTAAAHASVARVLRDHEQRTAFVDVQILGAVGGALGFVLSPFVDLNPALCAAIGLAAFHVLGVALNVAADDSTHNLHGRGE